MAPERTISPMPSQSSAKNVAAFFRGEEPNDNGVDIRGILAQNDQWLESDHQWIQWAFPLEKPSPVNPTAPVLDPAAIEAFRNDPLIRNHVLAVFRRVLDFYGLTMNAQGQIARGPAFAARLSSWLHLGSHHFRRITRIIHSLGLMLGPPNAYGKAFFDIMENIYFNEGKRIIPLDSYHIWKSSV